MRWRSIVMAALGFALGVGADLRVPDARNGRTQPAAVRCARTPRPLGRLTKAPMASPGKKPFLLRIDPELWAEIERLAAAELRSINAQVEYLLRDALAIRGRSQKSRAPGTFQKREKS
jgi:hypothetical protein